ncbi:MAG: hypothetical protein LKJ13_04640 [Clostridia bacterium]|jgi:hypothetical protein|nr:hypothetical protein [Clostridia bacterium]MCI1999715.1 hypothetical protein [Clostridia bacterium]MCI2013906.1 hypothetical protein [Clostridia bacterium]
MDKKIQFIQEFIDKCDDIINNQDSKKAKELENEIIGVFSNEISKLTSCLELSSITPHLEGRNPNYLKDIHLLKMKLMNYIRNLESQIKESEYKLELARLQAQGVNINNSNTANNSNNSSSNAKVDSTAIITLDQVSETISQIPEQYLTASQKEELELKLESLEENKNSKDKEKVKGKFTDVLKFISDKAEAGIAVLPYIAQIANYIAPIFK